MPDRPIPRATKWVTLIAIGAIAVLLIALALVPPSEQQPKLPSFPPFEVGNPVEQVCPSSGTFATTGCAAGDSTYNLTIEQTTIRFGEVLFQVQVPDDSVYVATGGHSGFSILFVTGSVVAQYSASEGDMSMVSGWNYALGYNASTVLTALYSIVVNMGTTNPQHQGYTFVATIAGADVGISQSSVALP